MYHSDTDKPETTPVTFILAGHAWSRCVTTSRSPSRFRAQAAPTPGLRHRRSRLLGLLEAIVDRTADILERVGARHRQRLADIFEPRPAADARCLPGHPARRPQGRLTSKVRESLVSIGRLVLFLANDAEGSDAQGRAPADAKPCRATCVARPTTRPISTNKINFLLDAMLGMVKVEQNNIIKIFSVAAVVLMPPTLIASIYGMNFKAMPELDWTLGYPIALALMIVSAIIP